MFFVCYNFLFCFSFYVALLFVCARRRTVVGERVYGVRDWEWFGKITRCRDGTVLPGLGGEWEGKGILGTFDFVNLLGSIRISCLKKK